MIPVQYDRKYLMDKAVKAANIEHSSNVSWLASWLSFDCLTQARAHSDVQGGIVFSRNLVLYYEYKAFYGYQAIVLLIFGRAVDNVYLSKGSENAIKFLQLPGLW